jgi:hypothetical protein
MQNSVRTPESAGPPTSHLLELRALILLTLAMLAGLAAATDPVIATGLGIGLATLHSLHRLVR